MTHQQRDGALVMDMLRAVAERDDARTLVRFLADRAYTAGEVLRTVEAVGAGFQAQGVRPGDRIAFVLPNRVEFLQCWLACHAVGAIAVPLNTSLRTDGLRHVFRSTSPVLVVCERSRAEDVRSALQDTASSASVFLVDTEEAPASDLAAFADLMSSPADYCRPLIADRDACCVMFTSGTTGPSKGVVWCNKMSKHVADVVAESMRYSRDDILYVCLPLFHGNALATSFLPALRSGAQVVVAERFSASKFWIDVADCRATATNILGVMSPILLRQAPSPAETEHDLRVALVIPAPEHYYQDMHERFNLPVVEAYGQVDVGMVLWNDLETPRPGSCGRPTRGFECRIVDDDDNEVKDGEVGHLVVRWLEPFTSLLGYWEHPAATAEAFRNLWFHTGDLMRRDPYGWYYFVDRAKDVIRRRGENISSFEVEVAVLEHPEVIEAAAFPVPSELSEDEVAVAVVLDPKSTLTPLGLVEFLQPKLPYFAVPRYVDVVGSLPRTQTEKVQKGMLKERGVTTSMWDREASGFVLRR